MLAIKYVLFFAFSYSRQIKIDQKVGKIKVYLFFGRVISSHVNNLFFDVKGQVVCEAPFRMKDSSRLYFSFRGFMKWKIS